MKKTKNITIEQLLTNEHLVQGALPSVAKIVKKAKKDKQIKLVYGETYDQFGLTIDSLKYYFFLNLLHQALETMDTEVSSYIIIGDLHSIRNKGVENKEEILELAQSRLQFVKKIKALYNLKNEFILMTDLFEEQSYKKRLSAITPMFQKSEKLKDLAKKTVLQNRISQEEAVGYQYTLEEVALIMGFDIKVGPPREIYYDQIAQELGKTLNNQDFCGLYLKPTYPLGLGFDFFITHPEIDEFGVTPYKAGSNKLEDNRIILGKTGLKKCQELISSSFSSSNQSLPNPVLDVYLIAKMAGYFLKNEAFAIDEDNIEDITILKSKTYQTLTNNIYTPLGLNKL